MDPNEEDGKGEKKKESPYRLNLVPGKEQRRDQWGMILISNIPVSVDFFHTDMMEKVIAISGKKQGEVKNNVEESKE